MTSSGTSVLRGEADFMETAVSLAFLSWLSHNVCSAVKHGHLGKEYNYIKRPYILCYRKYTQSNYTTISRYDDTTIVPSFIYLSWWVSSQ